jgi:hypothetical protein
VTTSDPDELRLRAAFDAYAVRVLAYATRHIDACTAQEVVAEGVQGLAENVCTVFGPPNMALAGPGSGGFVNYPPRDGRPLLIRSWLIMVGATL